MSRQQQVKSRQPGPNQISRQPGNENMSALDRLKMIQAQYKAQWIGINTDYTGRPGTSTMCNKERVFEEPKQAVEEMVRAERFMKIFDTLRNIEIDIPLLISAGNDR